jgi:hypothetical protein
MEVEKFVTEELDKIKDNQLYKEFNFNYAFPKNIIPNALLFVGLNPSADSNNDKSGKFEVYELKPNGNKHQYFKKFADVSEYCNYPWTHIDLLFFKETNQREVNNLLSKPNGVGYIWDQLQIAKKLIEMSNPKIIVVNNTLARTFLGKDKVGEVDIWLDYEFQFDEEIGTNLWNNIPVFFTSMLTGQRALDNGSYERLKWQVKRALKIISERS